MQKRKMVQKVIAGRMRKGRLDRSANRLRRRLTARVRQTPARSSWITKSELTKEATHLPISLKSARNGSASFRKRQGSQPSRSIDHGVMSSDSSLVEIRNGDHSIRYPKRSWKNNAYGWTTNWPRDGSGTRNRQPLHLQGSFRRKEENYEW